MASAEAGWQDDLLSYLRSRERIRVGQGRPKGFEVTGWQGDLLSYLWGRVMMVEDRNGLPKVLEEAGCGRTTF
jgi:hypothetical protein